MMAKTLMQNIFSYVTRNMVHSKAKLKIQVCIKDITRTFFNQPFLVWYFKTLKQNIWVLRFWLIDSWSWSIFYFGLPEGVSRSAQDWSNGYPYFIMLNFQKHLYFCFYAVFSCHQQFSDKLERGNDVEYWLKGQVILVILIIQLSLASILIQSFRMF